MRLKLAGGLATAGVAVVVAIATYALTGAELIKRIAADYPDIDFLSDAAIEKLEASRLDDLLAGKLD